MKGLFAAGVAMAASVSVPAAADVTAGPAHVHRVFDITRGGASIGIDTFDVTRSGDTTSVAITTHIAVKIAFVTAYRYDHTETQSWTGNQLVAFRSTTDDNGHAHALSATATGGKVTLTVDGTATAMPKTVMPASVWTAEIARHAQLFDPGNGKRMAVRGQDLGGERVVLNGVPRQLDHVKLSGQFDRDLWFDEGGLVKMVLRGTDNSVITSQLRQSTAAR